MEARSLPNSGQTRIGKPLLAVAVRLDSRLIPKFRVHIVAFIRVVFAVEQRTLDNAGSHLSFLFDGVLAYSKNYEYAAPTPAVLHLVTSDLLRFGLLAVNASHHYHSTAESADMQLHIAGSEDFKKFIAAARRDKRFKDFFTALDAADGLE
jgi:hypothetical protein